MKPIGVQMGNAKPVFGAGLGPGAFMRPAGNPGASGGVPPIPSSANTWGISGLFNWGPVPQTPGIQGFLDGDVNFLPDEPFELDYGVLASGDQICTRLYDQLEAFRLDNRVGVGPFIDTTNKEIALPRMQ